METPLNFNGVYVLLTTGQNLDEIQGLTHMADVILSVYPDHQIRVLWDRWGPLVGSPAH